MIFKRLRDKLLLGAFAISLVVTLASMLAVSSVIRQQFLDEANGKLRSASRQVDDALSERQDNLLGASRRLAGQKNLGSTIWYLTQYAQSGVDRETLVNTYQQLAKDTHKLGHAGKLSKVLIYNAAGELVSFAVLDAGSELAGFVERHPEPVFQVAALKGSEEISRQALHASASLERVAFQFPGHLPQQESVHYAIVDGALAIESVVPIVGMAFDPGSGALETKQLGLLVASQALDQGFVERLSRATDIKINVFSAQGLSSGSVGAYSTPDWGGAPSEAAGQARAVTFNEISVGSDSYYQCLIPLYTDKKLVGTIAALHSKESVRKNTRQMLGILALIAIACLLFIFPLAWYFATTISHPLTVLSRIFRDVAGGVQTDTLSDALRELDKEKRRHDELGDLTLSFIAMDNAVKQKILQINEINATLEHQIERRTRELSHANAELTKLAMHDALTGLPNRALFSDRLERALVAATRNKSRMALMFIDLDVFKVINDTYGHAIGDLVLKETARRVQECMRESDTVARIGGDEFMVLLPVIDTEVDAETVAENIRLALVEPFYLAGERLLISSSTGIAIFPDHGSDEHTLFRRADTAMYNAKQSGRNTVRTFSATAV